VRIFSLIAVTSLALAIAADLVGKSRYADAAAGVALLEAKGESEADLQHGRVLHVASYALAALGVVFWITSTIRRERCYHPVPTVLLVVYLLLQFVAV